MRVTNCKNCKLAGVNFSIISACASCYFIHHLWLGTDTNFRVVSVLPGDDQVCFTFLSKGEERVRFITVPGYSERRSARLKWEMSWWKRVFWGSWWPEEPIRPCCAFTSAPRTTGLPRSWPRSCHPVQLHTSPCQASFCCCSRLLQLRLRATRSRFTETVWSSVSEQTAPVLDWEDFSPSSHVIWHWQVRYEAPVIWIYLRLT